MSKLMSACALFGVVFLIGGAGVGCGDDGGSANRDAGILVDGDGTPIDGDGSPIPPPVDFDGGPINGGEACTSTSAQCNNCVDDDEDGLTDGQDFECVSPLDDDESSFATGIPGDNKDYKSQDCFFDGDSGAGNDGCNLNVCCLLNDEDCTDNSFDRETDCEVSDTCKSNCGAITPPGCDCFGCCTFCTGGECYDVAISPQVSPDCDEDVIADPSKCTPCVKSTTCGPEDCNDPDDCVLCPGQDPSELPESCSGTTTCPNDEAPCSVNADCPGDEYCSQGCCNSGFIVQ